MNSPICCGIPSLLNHALNKPFYVCTECKKEVLETKSSTKWTTYPTAPTPISIEEVPFITLEDFEQFELYKPWLGGDTLTTNDKEDDTNG